MTAVSAGPGKSASQIFFYDWSDNYRRVIKVEFKLIPTMTIITMMKIILMMTMMQEMKAREAAAKKEGEWTMLKRKISKFYSKNCNVII